MAVKRRGRNNKTNNTHKIYYWITGILILVSLIFLLRSTLTMYYYMVKSKVEELEHGYKELERGRQESEALKIRTIINKYKNKTFGIDISHHQGIIKWDSVEYVSKGIPVSFVFVRATRGGYVEDGLFRKNWKKLEQKKNIIRGAYHYYDVNRNSTDQAQNFIKTVRIKSGDLPPVLDVEELPKNQSMELLKKGLQNWLKLVEEHYKIKPVIYSNDAYFIHHIHDLDLSDYIIWVANYNPRENPLHKKWSFWQFSEKGIIKGIPANFVDLNVFNGSIEDLKKLTLK